MNNIKPNNYRPLSSVWSGEDNELLELMLNFIPEQKPKESWMQR